MRLQATQCLAAACVAFTLAIPVAHAANPKPISRMERAADAIEIQNIMGRYSIYVAANKWIEIGNMFALDEADVRQNVPMEMSGPAVREYFQKRDKEELKPGVLHQHSFLAPLIEVAGDGKTAKGVWDSVGIDTGSGDNMANWGWVRYAIDFRKVNDEWKIWHMKVMSLWNAPYGDAWSTMVQKASNGTKTGGAAAATNASAAPAGAGGPPAGAGMGAGPGAGGPPAGAGMGTAPGTAPAASSSVKWRYSGTDDTPVLPANPPKPYYTFDQKDTY